jgi:hypothetical protein
MFREEDIRARARSHNNAVAAGRFYNKPTGAFVIASV